MLIHIGWSITVVLVLFIGLTIAQEDSLQSALNAVDRRQRDLTPGYKNYYAEGGLGKYYLPDDKDDLAFLKPDDRFDLSDYLKEEDFNNRKDLKKHFSSPFRERIDRDKEREKEELSEMLINHLENNRDTRDDNEDYIDLLQLLYDRRNGKYSDFMENLEKLQSSDMKKRVFPSEYYGSLGSLGYNSVGLKKKSRYFDSDVPNDSLYLLNYAPRDELFERISDDDDDENQSSDYYNWNQRSGNDKRDMPYFESYSMKKRFPVAKRSNPPMYQSESKRTLNRGPRNLVPTDPKVAKDLSTVFGSAKTSSILEPKSKKNDKSAKAKKVEHSNVEKKLNKTNIIKKNENKEVIPNATKDEPLQIKKKSIDWSDYFGYDRKKKSNGDIDNEWLMERYHKAIAMATKRNAEYPLQHFHNHNPNEGSHLKTFKKKNDDNDEEAKLIEMDAKLKNIEDSIVDEALKYTGAHEGSTDSKEIQEIKDKVISRLAAAYSLEKMRQALGEYKMSIAKQRKEMQNSKELDDDSFFEEKRVSVPRKQAIDEDREKVPEGDNNIKCSHGKQDCDEQTYKPSSDIVEEESHWLRGDCPQIQRACNEVAEVLGHYGRTLEPACNIHQVCLFCGENSWFAPTRQCNVLFLAKADELCGGDIDCNKTANHSVRYLLDIYRSLRTEHTQECDLQCPDKRR